MISTDAQVRKLTEELTRHGKVGLAGLRSGMHRNTARRYRRAGRLPSQMRAARTWRTREDPFAADWPEIQERLEAAPELEAKALFEDLLARRPGTYEPGQLRTLQRRIRDWRAEHGPPKEVFFPQEHRPGELMQTDFTWMNELEVTIGGEPFRHMLCHPVLPYSNWEWGTVCFSESMLALRRGVQEAVFRLGRVSRFHQTDHSTAATHDLATGKRGYNEDYAALMRHLGMEPRTIAIGLSHQNGDVEAANGALKRRLEQHLLLRGSRDFESQEAYERWLWEIFERANALRRRRVNEELAVMRPVLVERLAECAEQRVPVSSWSTIQVQRNTYSVPSRLIGETVTVRRYESHLELYYAGRRQLTLERLGGEGRRAINYRHVIFWLIRKPGAFERYRYREELFPQLVFRQAYDALEKDLGRRRADIEYLRILHLAASTMESEVAATLMRLLEQERVPRAEEVRAAVVAEEHATPTLAVPDVDLGVYDALVEAAR